MCLRRVEMGMSGPPMMEIASHTTRYDGALLGSRMMRLKRSRPKLPGLYNLYRRAQLSQRNFRLVSSDSGRVRNLSTAYGNFVSGCG